MSTLHCRVTRTGYKLTLYAGRQLQQVQLSCCDVSGSRTSAGLQALSNRALPVEGRPVADILLCPCCVCVLSGSFLHAAHACSLSTVYLLFAWFGAIFLERAGAPQASLMMSCGIHVSTSCSPCTVSPSSLTSLPCQYVQRLPYIHDCIVSSSCDAALM
jgi:hypothetical protein